MKAVNWTKIQLMQNLHKLPTTVKPINISFTLYRQSSPLGIAPIPSGQLSSANGQQQIFDEDYFDHLISEIQEIRASERRFYQKITDIYATAVDYSLDSQITKDFFATVQNKMHYAVHGNTAAEVIVGRADHTKEHMGLTTWKNAPKGKIVKADVSIAKNYLSHDEMQELNEIVTMYLDYATRQARRHIPMTMEDWASKLDAFLQFNDAEILEDKGKVTAAIAKAFAESEFEKYRVIQDRLYQSDFDRLMSETENSDQ